MPIGYDPNVPKRAVNLLINSDLLNRAVALDVNLSVVLEGALAEAVARHQDGEWGLDENRNAVLDESLEQIDHNLLAAAIRVFGSEVYAKEWLITPARALGHKRPVDAGIEEVIDLIGRMEHGFGA